MFTGKSMKKRSISIVLNALIIVFEILGIIHNISFNHRLSLEFFTEQSNVLALFACTIFLFYTINNKKIPKWLRLLKYSSVVSLSITFLVVLFILFPMSGFNVYGMFLFGTLLYHHLICPILCFVTFIFYDEIYDFTKKDSLYSLVHVGIYGLIMIILNILKIFKGPYPFLMVYDQGLFMSIVWIVIIFLLSYGISNIIRVINSKGVK